MQRTETKGNTISAKRTEKWLDLLTTEEIKQKALGLTETEVVHND